ncbi:MAG: SDR family oxidoreductase [Acidimicrobiaceae bacterium]|nr:SDR family oxidoreductase [Acidimicrobiaceae bacterium]
MTDLSGVRALVTGASSGLGEAMADALLDAGAAVGFASRPSDRLSDVVERRRSDGLQAHIFPVDVRDQDSVQAAASNVRRTFGGLDLLVNNAGIGMRTVNPRFMEQPMPFYEVSAADFSNVLATNLTGYFLVASAFVPLLREGGSGRIVNVTMNHETMQRKGFVPYGPSRAGAESLSLIMTEDLRSVGISVNLLLPGGATSTGMIPEGIAEGARRLLLQPEVMAEPIVFLASPEAEGLTGERIVAKEFSEWLVSFRGRRM